MIMEKVSEKSNCLDPLALDVRAAQDWEDAVLIVTPRRSCVAQRVAKKWDGRTPSSVCTGRLLGESVELPGDGRC